MQCFADWRVCTHLTYIKHCEVYERLRQSCHMTRTGYMQPPEPTKPAGLPEFKLPDVSKGVVETPKTLERVLPEALKNLPPPPTPSKLQLPTSVDTDSLVEQIASIYTPHRGTLILPF